MRYSLRRASTKIGTEDEEALLDPDNTFQPDLFAAGRPSVRPSVRSSRRQSAMSMQHTLSNGPLGGRVSSLALNGRKRDSTTIAAATSYERVAPSEGIAEKESTNTSVAAMEVSTDLLLGATSGTDADDETENPYLAALEILFPFILAGMGMVFAGVVLDRVSEWPVFEEVPELFILVPALLGLKGNLEMTLASRLSTQASLGTLDTCEKAVPFIIGNLMLIQCQGIVVGFLAAVTAVLMSLTTGSPVNYDHWFLLASSSILTASVASCALASIMVLVVIASRHVGCNPDNIAAPMAASMGDLTTLLLLTMFSSYLHTNSTLWVELIAVLIYFFGVAPLCGWVAYQNELTRQVLIYGWTPSLASMCISTAGGLVLDHAVEIFPTMAAFQPVMNGAGGNLVAVQASRMATHLHCTSELGVLKEDVNSERGVLPWSLFCSNSIHTMTAKILMLLVVPGHAVFFGTILATSPNEFALWPVLFMLYAASALIQEWLLLYVCVHLVHTQWKKGIDPDSSAVPYLTALGDLVGTSLLAGSFGVMSMITHE